MRRGRPRRFDADEALSRAMHLFWAKGYEGTSLSELTAAMNINRPSLYAAFGDKESLFRKALDHYAQTMLGYINQSLEEPRARAAVERMLRGVVGLVTDPETPPGCLLVQGGLACGDGAAPVLRELSARRSAIDAALRRRLSRAKAAGELPPDTNPVDLTRYFMTVARGLAVQAAGGATRTELMRVVSTALRFWPD